MIVEQQAPDTSLRSLGANFWWLWSNALAYTLIVSADRFTFTWLVDDTLRAPKWASGVVLFALGVPVCAMVLYAGALADRIDRRRMLMATQLGGVAVLAVTGLIVLEGWMTVPLAAVCAACFGAVTAFSMPIRSSLVNVLVRREQLMTAVVLNTIASNVALIIGPVLVGFVIHRHGVGWAFVMMAAIVAIGVVNASRLRLPPRIEPSSTRRIRSDIADALRFVWHHDALRPLFGLLAAGGALMSGSAYALLPKIAKFEFGKEADEAAIMFLMMGLGLITTSVLVMLFRSRFRRRGLLFNSIMVVGSSTQILLGALPTWGAILAMLLFWGMCGGLYANLNQTLIQENTPTDRIGRVMALSVLVSTGLAPVGALVSSLVASAVGPQETLGLTGVIGFGIVVFTLLRARALRALP